MILIVTRKLKRFDENREACHRYFYFTGPTKSLNYTAHFQKRKFSKQNDFVRASRSEILRNIDMGNNVLIVGESIKDVNSNFGKTREAYLAARHLTDFYVFLTKMADEPNEANIYFPKEIRNSKKLLKIVLLIQNLDHYGISNQSYLIELIKKIKEHSCELVIIATSSILNIKDKGIDMGIYFEVINLEPLQNIPIEKPNKDNLSPTINKLYNLTEKHLVVFAVLKILTNAKIYLRQNYVRYICEEVTKINFGIGHILWYQILRDLQNNGLISIQDKKIFIEKPSFENNIKEKILLNTSFLLDLKRYFIKHNNYE